jgi:hypothetical protein
VNFFPSLICSVEPHGFGFAIESAQDFFNMRPVTALAVDISDHTLVPYTQLTAVDWSYQAVVVVRLVGVVWVISGVFDLKRANDSLAGFISSRNQFNCNS